MRGLHQSSGNTELTDSWHESLTASAMNCALASRASASDYSGTALPIEHFIQEDQLHDVGRVKLLERDRVQC